MKSCLMGAIGLQVGTVNWYPKICALVVILLLIAEADGVDGVGTGGGSQREMARLRQQNQQLHEENNLLKIKMDLLLDMVSPLSYRYLKSTCQSHH